MVKLMLCSSILKALQTSGLQAASRCNMFLNYRVSHDVCNMLHFNVPMLLHGPIKRGAAKRIGELPGVARSAATGSELSNNGGGGLWVGTWTKHIYGKSGLQIVIAQDPSIRSLSNSRKTHLRYQGKILCERRVHYYHGCKDLLKNRFCHVIDFLEFHD